jgi:hypothetical protein
MSRPSSPSLPLYSTPHEDSRQPLCLAVPPHQVPEQPPWTPILLEQALLRPQVARPQTNHEAADAELHLPPLAAHHRRPSSDPIRSSRRTLELHRAMSSLSGLMSCVDDPLSAPPLTSSPPSSTSLQLAHSGEHLIILHRRPPTAGWLDFAGKPPASMGRGAPLFRPWAKKPTWAGLSLPRPIPAVPFHFFIRN